MKRIIGADCRYFNGTGEDVRSKNLFIGVSVGVKPLDVSIANRYLEFGLASTTGEVAVLVADSIAKYNHEVFNRYREERSIAEALREGDTHHKIFVDAIAEMQPERAARVSLLKWNDITDPIYQRQLAALQGFFSANGEFKQELLGFMDKYLERRPRRLTEERKEYLCNYLLEELPALLDGIRSDEHRFDALLYPTYAHSGMSELATSIMRGKRFPELKKQLAIDGDVTLIECYLE